MEWQFDMRGEWSPVSSQRFPEDAGSQAASWEEWLRRSGYEYQGTFPEDCQQDFMISDGMAGFDLWRCEGDVTFPFVALVNLGLVGFEVVWFPTFPAVVRFWQTMAPVIQANSLLLVLNELRNIARLSFESWHGHGPETTCSSCNTQEAGRRLEAVRRMAWGTASKEGPG